MVSGEWSRDQLMQLIDLYREHNVLWDPTCRDFKDKNLKNNAWVEIANAMQMPKAEVQAKMRTLIGQFQREAKKPTSGSASEAKKWFAFHALLFLKDKTTPRRTREAGLVQQPNTTATLDDTNQVTILLFQKYKVYRKYCNVQIIDFEIFFEIAVLGTPEPKRVFFYKMSVCLSLCMFV